MVFEAVDISCCCGEDAGAAERDAIADATQQAA
jgi:hypothetical protein